MLSQQNPAVPLHHPGASLSIWVTSSFSLTTCIVFQMIYFIHIYIFFVIKGKDIQCVPLCQVLHTYGLQLITHLFKVGYFADGAVMLLSLDNVMNEL